MVTVGPGETITISQSGIPTAQVVGYQVIKAATGAVAIGRTTTGVSERPAGSGNYVATFVAPVEVDMYLVVLDWNGGVITTTKSKVEEIQVTSAVAQATTGLGLIADYVKTSLGGDTFQLLLDSANYGASYITLSIEAVKARVLTTTLLTVNENTLPVVVLSYLGKLSALQLIPAAIDLWSDRAQSRSFGSDPTEIVTYPAREAMLKMLTERLLAEARMEAQLALTLLPDARLLSTSSGPSINEDALGYVTRDPRQFPREHEFPYRGGVFAPPVVAATTEELFGP